MMGTDAAQEIVSTTDLDGVSLLPLAFSLAPDPGSHQTIDTDLANVVQAVESRRFRIAIGQTQG